MDSQKSWGKSLVILTIIVVSFVVGMFFTRLTVEAKHSYHSQMKAKEVALKIAKENNLKQIKLDKKVKLVAQKDKKKWLTDEEAKKADSLMKRSDCIACHNPAVPTVLAPQFGDIAKKYAGADEKVIKTLVLKVQKGGKGNWQPKYVGLMTPHEKFLDGEKMTKKHIELMVKRVLDAK